LSIEKPTETINENCTENWINEFVDRYLIFEKMESASR